MYKNGNTSMRTMLATLLLITAPTIGMSQSIWLPPSEGHSVSLEAFKADLNIFPEVTRESTIWFLTGRYKVNSSITIVSDLPLSYLDYKSFNISPTRPNEPIRSVDIEAETAIGNPYFGLLYNSNNSGLIGEFGLRLPSISEDDFLASVNGKLSSFDRWESFIPDLLTVRGRIGKEVVSNSGKIHTRFLGGLTLWIPVEDRETEVFADLVGQIWLKESQFMIGGTIISRSMLTDRPRLNLYDRTVFQIGIGVNRTFGHVRTGFHIHAPLGRDKIFRVGSAVNVVIGINISVLLGERESKH